RASVAYRTRSPAGRIVVCTGARRPPITDGGSHVEARRVAIAQTCHHADTGRIRADPTDYGPDTTRRKAVRRNRRGESGSIEADPQHDAADHRREAAGPAPAVCDPAAARPRNRRSEDGAEESRDAGGGAGRLIRDEIERVQTHDHDRTVDDESNREPRDVIDP